MKDFISIKGRVIDNQGSSINNVLILSFINNSKDVFYDGFSEKYLKSRIPGINEENLFAKTDRNGFFNIDVYFSTWSEQIDKYNEKCNDYIRRIDIIFFKEGYLPLRKIIMPIRNGIEINYNKPGTWKIDIGNVVLRNFKEEKKRNLEIIYGKGK